MNPINPITKIIVVMTCFFVLCLERFIKQISKNAYIHTAITGKSFCYASWDAYTLMIKQAPQFGFGYSIGYIFMLTGVITIS